VVSFDGRESGGEQGDPRRGRPWLPCSRTRSVCGVFHEAPPAAGIAPEARLWSAAMTDPAARAIRLDDLDRIPLEHGFWRPVRRPFGITAFGVNAYSADGDGDDLIEPHDEASPGSGRHEELYLVATGAATFTVAGERIDAPAGTHVFVPPGVDRQAVAAAANTTVVVIGGRPGAGLPVSPFEYWYAAGPAYDAGDWRRAIEILSEGLGEWPDHPQIHYILACFHARAGDRDEALHHLRFAAERDASALEHAAKDPDFDALRDDPEFPAG
jgi:hypothetical protein